MSSNVIRPRVGPHPRCDLPNPDEYPYRTVAQCSTCGQWWWCTEFYAAFGFNAVWSPVCWWHWRLRRTIRQR